MAPLGAEPGSWHAASDLLTPRRLLAAAEQGGKIYTFGGCGSPCFAPPLHISDFEERLVEVYDPDLDPRLHADLDPQTQPWSRLEPMPSIVFGAAAAAPGDGSLYVFGGFVTGTSTLRYEPGARRWTAKAPMPTPRHGLAAAAWGGKVYVVGGSNGTTALSALEVYDPADGGSWRQLPAMPTARVFLAAVAVDGKIYAIGGSPDCCGDGTTDVVEVYDIEHGTWRQEPSLSLPLRMQTSAAAAIGGKIYVLGGFVPGQGATGRTYELDPANPQAGWIEQRAMPEPRDQAPAVALPDGIHVLGGATNCHCSPRRDHPTFHPEPSDHLPELEITKTVDVADACPGQTIEYTIIVANHGTGDAHSAIVDDPPRDTPDSQNPFIAQLRGATWRCEASPGAACATADHQPSAAHSTPLHDVVDLPAGGTITYTVTGTIDLGASGRISNRAEVQSAEGVESRSPPVTTVVRRDRLEIRKTEVPARDAVAPLDLLLYEVTATNHCRIPLPVTVEDPLSTTGLSGPRWCCGGAGCSPSTAGDLSATSTVPPGGSVTYRVSGTVPCDCAAPLATIVNPATARAPGQDSVTATDVDTVSPADDRLQVAITGPATLAGCSGDYAIAVSNLGPCTAPNVVLTVLPPAGLNLVSLSPPCATGSPCALGNIAAGPSSAVTVTARFAAASGLVCPVAPPPSIVATARSLCSQPPEPAATASSTVAIPCDLGITKTDGLAAAAPGDCILYTIVVGNNGCGDVLGATVTDIFPVELATATWCRGVNCVPSRPGPLVDTLDLRRPNNSIFLNLNSETYHVAGSISPTFTGTLANTASVTLANNAADANPANDTATDTTTVKPRPGVDAQCTGTQSRVAEGASVTFTKVLWNGGPAAQADNPGDEFVDALPAGLTLVSAVASSGIITVAPANTVHWNGAIPVGGMVTIDVTVTVDLGTIGMSFCNSATINFDADGDGVNESSAALDDRCHPCCFMVTGPAPIPALSPLGLAVLAILAAVIGVARLRARAARHPPT
ncbi:MAG TPA: IPTL-CTERM sorting domain-containing protein [Thermoanaerobaculia bacterium]|nr:IPTL-CTERM sorting domain-containing protein [Thermoanaerobaculia bacterium]